MQTTFQVSVILNVVLDILFSMCVFRSLSNIVCMIAESAMKQAKCREQSRKSGGAKHHITVTYLKIFIPRSRLDGTDIAQEIITQKRKQLHQNLIAVIIFFIVLFLAGVPLKAQTI